MQGWAAYAEVKDNLGLAHIRSQTSYLARDQRLGRRDVLALAQDPSRSITLALPAPGHAEQAKDIARHEGNGPYC